MDRKSSPLLFGRTDFAVRASALTAWERRFCGAIMARRLIRRAAGASFGARDRFFVHQALQLARLVHLHHDVRSADEFTLHIKLRNGGPVRIGLDALAHVHVLQHIDAVIVHAQMIEDRDRAAGKPALGEQRRAFHEQDNIAAVHFTGNLASGLVIHDWILSNILGKGAARWPARVGGCRV